MNVLGNQLLELARAARLTMEQLALQVAVAPATLQDAVDGRRAPSAEVVARCAMLAGLEPDEFLRGASVAAPPLALLRSAGEVGPSALAALGDDHAPWYCGELLHRARFVQMIERASGLSRATLPPLPRGPVTESEHPAEGDARRAREALGISDGPIESVREVLEQYGVLIVWTEDEVPESIEGISLLHPIASVLVNLRHGRERHWHTRMTLAHELGHLLFDHPRRGAVVMHSPSMPGRAVPFEGFDELERSARAFAACFLAPAHLVRRCVGLRAPDSDDAVTAVGRHFGVGRTVAINRLQAVFRFTDEARDDLTWRQGRAYQGPGRKDIPEATEVGLRRGVFRQRVLEALSRGLIPRTRAWSLLGVPPTEPLEEPLPEHLRTPLVSREHAALLLAHRALRTLLGEGTPWSPVSATEGEGGRWTVQLLRGVGAPSDREVSLTLSADGTILGCTGDQDLEERISGLTSRA